MADATTSLGGLCRAMWHKLVPSAAGPVMEPTRVNNVSTDDAGQYVIRAHNTWVDGQYRGGERQFHRHDSVAVINRANGRKVVRMIAACRPADMKFYSREAVGLDYNARALLGLPREVIGGGGADLVVRRANTVDHFIFAWNHTDLSVRYAMRGMVVSVVLGVIGVVLGAWSVLLAL